MSDDEQPMIELPVPSVVCRVHGEPFRAKWPTGYIPFSLYGFKALSMDPAAGFLASIGGDIALASAAFAERPICSRLTADQLVATYIEAGFGVEDRCEVCHEHKAGAPFTMAGPPPRSMRHVCFRCVAEQPCQPR